MSVFDSYVCDGQMNLFEMEKPKFLITKPLRLIELFAGVGSQSMAVLDLGVDFEHYRVVEFDKYAIKSYNAIHGTNFPTMDIKTVTKEDLGIIDVEHFTYLLTYSFPCQDLSVAGKGAGMTKGSGTRSGLLWEVERLLNETPNLPQVLLMENVPQVHGKKNVDDFNKWIDFLKSKGYSNYWQDLNAKNYGVAQNRNRCFMVSILGNYSYEFPKEIPLTKTMKDYLEESVDEKYYINNEKAQKLIDKLINDGTICQTRPDQTRLALTSLSVSQQKTKSQTVFVQDMTAEYQTEKQREVALLNVNKLGFIEKGTGQHQRDIGVNRVHERKIGNIFGFTGGNYAGNVYDHNYLAPTLNTMQGGCKQPLIIDSTIVAMRGRNPDNPSDRTVGSPTEQRLEPNSQGICNTLTSVQKDNMVMESIKIKQATKDGYIECKVGGGGRSEFP